MVTLSDLADNNVTLRKVNSSGLHSLDEMEPAMGASQMINDSDQPLSPAELEEMERKRAETELRHTEILFKIERYGIIVFALFFMVFNIVYWVDLLHSAKFDER
jgi:hypothetical protein